MSVQNQTSLRFELFEARADQLFGQPNTHRGGKDRMTDLLPAAISISDRPRAGMASADGVSPLPASITTRPMVLDVALHLVMISVMVFTMAIDRSVPAALAGSGVLILLSMCCAPLARRHRMVWDHLMDLWAMAMIIIVMAFPADPDVVVGAHAHGFTPERTPVMIAVLAAWIVARLLRGRRHLRAGYRSQRRDASDLWWQASAALSGLGLGVMVVLCLG